MKDRSSDNQETTFMVGTASLSAEPASRIDTRGRRFTRAFTRGRVLAGVTALAIAVTLPDISLSAMTSPYFKVTMREPSPVLSQPIWSPQVRAVKSGYAPVAVPEELDPSAVTATTRTTFVDDDRLRPLTFLEIGSEQFDLAFAGVQMPAPVAFTVAPALPSQRAGQLVGQVRSMTSPIRTKTLDIPQITSNVRVAPVQARRAPDRPLTASSNIARSAAFDNETAVAAFAGTLGVSTDLRGTLPVSPVPQRQISQPQVPQTQAPQPQAPQPQRQEPARAVPLPVPKTGTSGAASATDRQTELVIKSRLDARINGVVTGQVDFRQMDGTIGIRLGSVVDMLRNRYQSAELDALIGARALDAFVTLAQLQSAGIPIDYDPVYDEVDFGVDYNDAPQAVKVQVEQIGAPVFTSETAMIDQIPR